MGMKLWRQSASLATRRSGFDSRRLHPSLRSVNGKHAPFVRSRCGFDSCRRLSHTPVAQWTERCPATAAVAGSTPAGRTCSRGRSSDGRAPERHSGEARSTRAVRSSQTRGVAGARRAPTSQGRVRFLAGLPFTIVAGRSGSVISWRSGPRGLRFDSAHPTAPHDRDDTTLLRAGTAPVIDSNHRSRVRSRPEPPCSGSSVVEQLPVRDTTTAAVPLLRGPERDGSRVERPAQAGGAGSSPAT